MLESFQYGSKCLQFPASLVHFVFTAETEVVEPDVCAVLVVTCHERNAVMTSQPGRVYMRYYVRTLLRNNLTKRYCHVDGERV